MDVILRHSVCPSFVMVHQTGQKKRIRVSAIHMLCSKTVSGHGELFETH